MKNEVNYNSAITLAKLQDKQVKLAISANLRT